LFFDTVRVKYGAQLTSEDETIAEQTNKYWANFAITAGPNGAGLTTWPRYSTADELRAPSMNPVTACPGTAVAVPTLSADRCALTAHAGLTIAQETVQTVLLIIVTFVGTWLRLYRVPWQVSGDPCLVAEVLEISAKRM
jgi:hypothetical protein